MNSLRRGVTVSPNIASELKNICMSLKNVSLSFDVIIDVFADKRKVSCYFSDKSVKGNVSN